MNEFEAFIKKENERREDINKLADVLKNNINAKHAEKILPDGSKQMVTKSFDPWGKEVFTASKDGKNVMTFSNKKQLLDYLGD